MLSDRTENVVRGLLIVVGIGLLGFIGWSVWHEERHNRERRNQNIEPAECGLCAGTGKCSACQGKATVPCWQCRGKGGEVSSDLGGAEAFKECNVCQGRKYLGCNTCLNSGKCKTCGGAGKGVVLP